MKFMIVIALIVALGAAFGIARVIEEDRDDEG